MEICFPAFLCYFRNWKKLESVVIFWKKEVGKHLLLGSELHSTTQTCPPEVEAPPPNDLLKLAEFVNEECCESQGRGNEGLSSYIFEETTRIDQKSNVF